MSSDFVAGIDVAGDEKGFQAAILREGDDRIDDVFQKRKAEEVSDKLVDLDGDCLKIAIDSPPKALRDNEETRLAERQIYSPEGQNGTDIYVQWTQKTSAPNWMIRGERLWDELGERFSEDCLIETFPTACTTALDHFDVTLPLRLIDEPDERKLVKDYYDASICALVARESEKQDSRLITIYGLKDEPIQQSDLADTNIEPKDELGPIYVIEAPDCHE